MEGLWIEGDVVSCHVDLHNIHIFACFNWLDMVQFHMPIKTIKTGPLITIVGAIVEVQEVTVVPIGITNTVHNIVDCQAIRIKLHASSKG